MSLRGVWVIRQESDDGKKIPAKVIFSRQVTFLSEVEEALMLINCKI